MLEILVFTSCRALYSGPLRLHTQPIAVIMSAMIPDCVVPMNNLRSYLTMHCCQITSVVKLFDMEECKTALFRQLRNYAYDCSSTEIRNDLILYFTNHQLVSDNPFRVMCAAVVRQDHLTVAVMVQTIRGSMCAAANIIIFIACENGNDLLCAAVQAVMPYQGIAQAA